MVELNPYSGTSALVVEYDDLVRSPMFEVIKRNRKNESLKEIVDLSEIEYLYDPGVYEWYKHRRHRNPLLDLYPREGVDEDYLNNVMRVFLEKDATYTSDGRILEFADCIKYIIGQHFKMKYYVYSEFGNPYVIEDMKALFPAIDFNLLEGDFAQAISVVGDDVTWAFSDINKVAALAEQDRLNLSGIMMGLTYDYNFKIDDPSKTVVDIDKLKDSHAFKFTPFNIGKFSADEAYEIIGEKPPNPLESIMPGTKH